MYTIVYFRLRYAHGRCPSLLLVMAKNGIEPMDTDKPRKIHFGSLEEVERGRLKQQQQAGSTSVISPGILAGIKAGNINIVESESFVEYYHDCIL